jgi:phosphate starvation-inducible PhoH-like protein
LLDALHDLMDYDQIRRYMDHDLIEIAPLAYMRGRTLNDAVIILDEGQNATVPQMKMFLTRMGQNARIVVTGDITQVDLPLGTRSGLADAVERLGQIPGVATILLDRSDIVRHPLVQAIVNAYEASETGRERDGREESGAERSGERAQPPQPSGPENSGPGGPAISVLASTTASK